MSKQVIQKLVNYIDKNADFIIINRAFSYAPELVMNTEKVFDFVCYGSESMPYRIKIEIKGNQQISSSCTCPYDYAGICKHQVAAINKLIDLIQAKKVLFKAEEDHSKAKDKTLFLPHQDGTMNREELRTIKFQTEHYKFGFLEIMKLQKNKIVAQYKEYRKAYKLVLEHNKSTDEITLSCSCNVTQNCYHKYLLLKKLKDDFSLDYFSPNLEEILKKEVLEKEGLTGKIDFDDAFTLAINKDGIFVEPKIKNLLAHPKSIFQPISKSELKQNFKPIANTNSDFDIAFCFQIYEDKIETIFPMYGKLNKQKTEISAKTKPIDEYDLADAMRLLSIDDASLMPICFRVKHAFDETVYQSDSLEAIDAFAQEFKTLRKVFQQKKFYLHHVEDNFARKYLKEVQIIDSAIQPKLKITAQGKFYQLNFQVVLNGKTYDLDHPKIIISGLGVLLKNQLFLVSNAETLKAMMSFSRAAQITIINEGIQQLKEQIISPYSSIFHIDFNELKQKKATSEELKPTRQVYLSEADEAAYIVFQPIIAYGEHQVLPLSPEKIWVNSKKLISLQRDEKQEQDFLSFIQNLHPAFEGKTDFFYLKTEDALADLWIMEAIDQLKKENIQVFGLAELKGMKYNLNKPTFNIGLTSGTDWFDMNLDIAFGDQKVDLKKLQKAIVKNSNYVELADGSLGILPHQWIEKYKKYFKLGQIKKNKIEISNFQFNIIDELYEELENSPDFLKELHEKKQRIANLKKLKEIKPSKHLKAELRHYQKEGLNWLVFLHENKLGGCLADDMGLGKTLQSIAFLQHLKDQQNGKTTRPSLIVAPTSLMFNWVAEFEKFAPKLNFLLYYGSNRETLRNEINTTDIVLTTYGSLVKDIEFHQTQAYNYVILDESQNIKNPQSQRFKAVRLLQCNNRLALTGTPIENNTFDLYSQFNFLNPGIFGSIKHFRTSFSEAIDKDQDEEVSTLLSKMIHPFILRRTKDQVATELPSKTETVIYCEMGKKQRKVYEEFKQYFRQKLQEQIETEGVKKSQMYILQGLTKLRQICNSTALADKENDYGNHSAKLDELIIHLKEKVSKHKVLVFSQFVGMLQLVKERLIDEKIEFEYLDGQTRNREEKVTSFKQNKNISVFLISLKAGGTGLNLTEADYVYLIDPWWNPAVENQAIDRCYRIGQDKKVMAYRMICKDSIEEKITTLQDKKKTVAAEVIRTDLEKKSFDKEDVALLFGNL